MHTEKDENTCKGRRADGTEMADHDIDQGYSWVVLVSSTFLLVFTGFVFFTGGLLIPSFMEAFDINEVSATLLVSVQCGVCLVSGYIAGLAIDWFSCKMVGFVGSLLLGTSYAISSFVTSYKLMIITFSIIPGLGLGCMYVSGAVMVQHYFIRKRVIATGIFMAGGALGGFLMPPLFRYLLDEYTWRGCLLCFGPILANGCVAAMLLRQPSSLLRKADMDNSRTDMFEKNSILNKIKSVLATIFDPILIKKGKFDIFLIIVLLMNAVMNTTYIFMPLRMASLGFSGFQAALFISLIGLGDVIGRLFFSWLVYASSCDAMLALMFSFLFMALMTAILTLVNLLKVFYFCAFGYGLGYGCLLSLAPTAVLNLLGLELFAKAFGLQLLSCGTGLIFGPIILAKLYGVFDSMEVVFGITGCTQLISALLACLLVLMNLREKRISKNQHSDTILDNHNVIEPPEGQGSQLLVRRYLGSHVQSNASLTMSKSLTGSKGALMGRSQLGEAENFGSKMTLTSLNLTPLFTSYPSLNHLTHQM